jgi:hypothetical protein
MKKKTTPLILTGLLLVISLNGCAFGVTNLRVAHSPLESVAQKREGTILVQQFVDKRKEDHQYIGTKRDGLGIPLGNFGVRDGKRVDVMITEFFVDALKHAGYDAVIQTSSATQPPSGVKVNVILQGEINKFWLDLYLTTWHHVDVDLKLLDKDGKNILWVKNIQGGKANVLWVGLNSEFEKVIRQALDEALNRAAKEFASEEFYQKVKTAN